MAINRYPRRTHRATVRPVGVQGLAFERMIAIVSFPVHPATHNPKALHNLVSMHASPDTSRRVPHFSTIRGRATKLREAQSSCWAPSVSKSKRGTTCLLWCGANWSIL